MTVLSLSIPLGLIYKSLDSAGILVPMDIKIDFLTLMVDIIHTTTDANASINKPWGTKRMDNEKEKDERKQRK